MFRRLSSLSWIIILLIAALFIGSCGDSSTSEDPGTVGVVGGAGGSSAVVARLDVAPDPDRSETWLGLEGPSPLQAMRIATRITTIEP
jgi:hypothetical protein